MPTSDPARAPMRARQRRLTRAAGALVTGPVAFLIAGLIDFASLLRVALAHLWRSTIRSRWLPRQGSSED